MMDLNERKKQYRSEIVLGTQYYRQPTPLPAEWEGDLKKIKSMGMEYIQLRPQWRWHERKEGNYRWDDIDHLVDLAEKTGLKIIFKFMLETAPDYIFNRYDGYRVGLQGEKIWPIAHGAYYPGGWIPCFDHPVVMDRAKEFLRQGVLRYRDRDVIALWHAWNEPRARPIGECTCEHSRASYHQWLKERFGMVDNLNDFLGKCWGEFEDIDTPRNTADFAEMYLWRQWAASRVAWRVGEVTRTIKSLDPTREVVAHVGLPSVFQDVLADTSDDYLTRKSVDFYGSSMEVRYSPKAMETSWPFLMVDWIRAVSGDGYFWMNEVYPSRGRWEPEVSPHTVAGWLWACLACGAKGIVLWQFRKERLGLETNDAGLMEMNGRDNPTSREVDIVFHLIRSLRHELNEAIVPKAKVAIVYDFESDLVSRIEETEHGGDFHLRKSPYTYKAALQSAYHLFWMAGIPVDMVSSHEMEKIHSYEMTYLPIFFAVDNKKAKIMKEYVANGGVLVAEGGTAMRDTNSWLHTTRPGAGLRELFGLVEVERVVDEHEKREVICLDGRKFVSRKMNTSFQLTTAKLLGWYDDGSPAIAENTYGRGKAVMTGFSPGLAYLDEPNLSWGEWIRDLVSQHIGFKPDTSFMETGIYVRELQSSKHKFVFLFNLSEQLQNWTVRHDAAEVTTGQKYNKDESLKIPAGRTAILFFETVDACERKHDKKSGKHPIVNTV
jgi:beta-galactosidase